MKNGTRDPGPGTRNTTAEQLRLEAGLATLQLGSALRGALLRYLAELRKWNNAYSLTAVRAPADMVTRHLLDSLVALPFLPGSRVPGPESRLLDVGSGAGLPGVPLAIARPDLAVTLLDSNGKKARFLRHVRRTLALDNVEVVEARAEAFRPAAPFDAVITRAFGSLADFLRHTAHLGAAHGQWLAMKGKLDEPELNNVPEGFVVKEIVPLTVPGLAEERHLICVSRVAGPASRVPAP